MDVENSKSCTDFKDLPEIYIIFITETDVFKANKPIYHIDRIVRETNEEFKDREHIIYINAAYEDETTLLGKLLHDFMCSDPKDMIVPEIAECANMWKNTKKGVDGMCKAVEDYAKEKELNKTIEIAVDLLKEGQTVTFTSKITKLAIDFVKQLAIDNGITYTI